MCLTPFQIGVLTERSFQLADFDDCTDEAVVDFHMRDHYKSIGDVVALMDYYEGQAAYLSIVGLDTAQTSILGVVARDVDVSEALRVKE